MELLTLTIDGMSCGHCVARVRQTLSAAPGVHVSEVSIGSAAVTYDHAATSPEKIASVVQAAGYHARPANGGAAR